MQPPSSRIFENLARRAAQHAAKSSSEDTTLDARRVDLAAETVHEMLRIFCDAAGNPEDEHYKPWSELTDDEKDIVCEGVQGAILGDTAEASHARWMDAKLKDGWTLGSSKDATEKKHPSLVPYEQLSAYTKFKDQLLVDVARRIYEGQT